MNLERTRALIYHFREIDRRLSHVERIIEDAGGGPFTINGKEYTIQSIRERRLTMLEMRARLLLATGALDN